MTNSDTDSLTQLYTINGAIPGSDVFIDEELPVGSNSGVTEYFWSPDSSKIAYVADFETVTTSELFVANSDGTNHKKLSGDLLGTDEVDGFFWSSDSRYVANVTRRSNIGIIDTNPELYVADSLTAVLEKASLDLIEAANIKSFSWSPVDNQILYRADHEFDDLYQLHSYTAGQNDSNIRLNTLNTNVADFKWSLDGGSVAYKSEDNALSSSLYIVLPEQGEDNLIATAGRIWDFQWSPDNTTVAFTSENSVGENPNRMLHSVTSSGGPVNVLNTGILQTGDIFEFA